MAIKIKMLLKILCLSCTNHISRLNICMWLVVTILNNGDKGYFHHCRESDWTGQVDSGCPLTFLTGHHELFLSPFGKELNLGKLVQQTC